MRKTLNIGRLSKRVTLCKFTDTEDAMGQSIQSLTKVAEVWGDIYPVRGTEFYEVQKLQSKVTHKCYVRYREEFADVDSNWYLIYGGKIYDIDSAVDVDMERKMIEIRCYERVNRETHRVEE